MEDRAFVMASGFDLTEDGQVEATLQIALPTGLSIAMQGGGATKEPFVVVTDKGREGTDILQHLQEMISRRVFLGHRGVIIFGEAYAREGIDEILDTFLRSPESRYTTFILTAKGVTAKEILNTPHQFLEEIPALGLKKKQQIGISLAVKLNEFLDAIASDGKSPMTGVIQVLEKKADQKIFKLGEAAVYQDNKLVGFLPEEEMKTLFMLRGEAENQNLTAQVKPIEEGFKGTMGVRVLRSKSTIDIQIKDEIPEIMITLEARVVVLENDSKLDLSKEKKLKEAESKFNEQVDQRFVSMLEHIQKEFKADVFGFGNEVHIKHPEYWKMNKDKWKKIYPKIPISTRVDITIIGIGRAQAPPHLEK